MWLKVNLLLECSWFLFRSFPSLRLVALLRLHGNVRNRFEPIPEAALHIEVVVRLLYCPLLISQIILVRRRRHARNCWWSKNELLSYVPFKTPATNYIRQLCVNTGCRLDDVQWEIWMIGWDSQEREREREREIEREREGDR